VEDRTLTKETLPGVIFPEFAGPEGISTRSAMGLADVFACVRVLCDGATMAPLQVYRRNASGAREQVEDGTAALLDAPAPGVMQAALVIQIVASLALAGEAFVGKYKLNGEVTSLRLLPADRMEVEIIGGEPRFRYHSGDGSVQENLTLDDVVHIRGITLDGVRGASPIKLCREAVGLSKSLTEASANLAANGGVPAGILKVPPGPQSQEAAANLSKAWQERHGGPGGAGRVAVLTGEIGFEQVSMSLADAEWIESRKLSTVEICRLFRIPAWMVNAPVSESLTYSTVSQQADSFARFSLGPVLRLVESALSADGDLFPAPGHYCRFSLEGLLRADPSARAAFYTAALNNETGWMTRSEVRALEDLPAEDGATNE
jgi:HK97 family phage portal protein